MRYSPTIAVLVASLVAASVTFAEPPATSQQATEDATETEATAAVAPTEPTQSSFDPALVGLADFPIALESQEDFSRAEKLIDARIAELTELTELTEQGAAVQDDTEGQDDEAQQGESPPADSTPKPQDDRIEQLQALRIAVQRTGAIFTRTHEIEAALAEQQALLDALRRDGIGIEPPYSVTLLDQLQTERLLAKHSEEMASRSRSQARQREEATEKALEAAVRERRATRTRLEQAAEGPERTALELRLEQVRLAELVSRQQHAAAVAQRRLAAQESALADAQQALLDAKLELVRSNVVYPREALDERLAEVQRREAAMLARVETLTQSGDKAESMLFQARLRLQRADPDVGTAVLREQVSAREDELSAARKGAEYLRQAADLADTARTMLERRYALMQGADTEQWPQWLRDAEAAIGRIDEEREFIYAQVSALRSIHLALTRRLSVPDLDPELKRALSERIAALNEQEALAEELLTTLDQVRSLAERLRAGLAPLVRERSMEQRLEEARDQIAAWWHFELFAVDDQGVYVRDVVTGIGVFLLVLLVVSMLKSTLRRKVLPRLALSTDGQERKTSRAAVSALIRNTSQWFVLIVAFYVAMSVSGLAQGSVQDWLGMVLVVALYLQIGLWANAGVVDFFRRKRSKKEREDPSAVTGYGLLLFFIRSGIWIVVLISLMAYFKYPVAGLVGALGVGGIAVAFAVQNILGDVFSSLAIILDKPFRVGDFIIAGDTIGAIEHIGVKTTRIRSLSGELVVMSNTDLLGSCIHNYKHMQQRRVVFKLGVIYQTPPETLERIPQVIEAIIREQRLARFDRAHFAEYGDFALTFEIVYYVIGADYNLYMDTQQAINLAIYRAFKEMGVEFAYPTQQVFFSRVPSP